MAKRRIVVYNTVGDCQRIPAAELRRGDVMLASGERVSIAKPTRDGRMEVTLVKDNYPRKAFWAKDTRVAIQARDKDGVGSPEEVAYGEGWHSKAEGNPYTDPTQMKSWEQGRAAAKLKRKFTSFKGETRGTRFEQPRARDELSGWIEVPFKKWDTMQVGDRVTIQGRVGQVVEKRAALAFVIKVEWARARDAGVVTISRNPTTNGLIVKTPDGKQYKFGSAANAVQQANKEAKRLGCEVKNEVTGSQYDYKSERGFVARLIEPQTGKLLARSEPHISNGEGLKKWIRTEAKKLIDQGKRVQAEVVSEFYDPQRV